MKTPIRQRILVLLLGLACLLLSGCSGNVGVGMSVGVPIGDHGYISIGGGNWF
jgi:outer membrane biogenesis lipoprotein LolB